MKSLVTGASGYIGSAMATALAERGDELVLHYYRQPPADALGATMQLELGAEDIRADELAGVDVVYHCAGIAHQQADVTAYQRVNYLATMQLAEAASAAGVRHLVFLSSVKAASTDSAYGYYKRETELALKCFADNDMAVSCVRPALVYGEQAPGNLGLLLQLVRYGMPLPPDWGGRSMIALPDLVSLLLCVSSEPHIGFSCVNATDGEVYSTRRLCRALRYALGRPRDGGLRLPDTLWRAACAVADGIRTSDQSVYERLFGDDIHSNTSACERFDWRPSLCFEDVARNMVLS